ncbi:MAG: hypothetical protein Q8P67_00490 [archaeon]|nr:hypothetical protein [archaeon]
MVSYLSEEELIARCQSQHSASFVLELAPEGGFPTFVCINHLFSTIFGFSPADLVNHGVGIIIPSSTLQILKQALVDHSSPQGPGSSSISSSFNINFYNSVFKEIPTVCTITLWYNGRGLPQYTLFNIIPLPSAPPTWSSASAPLLGEPASSSTALISIPRPAGARPSAPANPASAYFPDLGDPLDLDAFFALDPFYQGYR